MKAAQHDRQPSEPEIEFDYVISLGASCRVTWNLRKAFDFSTAFPFDWWVTPIAAVVSVIEGCDASHLYDPELLVERSSRSGEISTIEHCGLGIGLHHEFPKSLGDNGEFILPDWRNHLEKPKLRTQFLLERLYSLNRPGIKLLFVRHGVGWQSPTFGAAQAVEQLKNAIWVRFNLAHPHLLLINCPGVEDASIAKIEFEDQEGIGWRGDIPAWATALGGLPYRLTNPKLKPFDARLNPGSRRDVDEVLNERALA
jgi:hypothetical protein